MEKRRQLLVPLVVLTCAFMLMLAPAVAQAEPKTFSLDDQLPTSVYDSLGLPMTDLDEAAAVETAPLDATSDGATTTVLTKNDTYIAAKGHSADTYTLRSRLNRLDDNRRSTGVYDGYGDMVGAYRFYEVSDFRNQDSDGHRRDGALSDNSKDVIKAATNNGFDGKYATSVACDLGSGWDDHVAELRAYGDDHRSMAEGITFHGGFEIQVYALDSSGNRTKVATFGPKTTESQVWADGPIRDGSIKDPKYLNAGYLQELDAVFEIEAADVDNDGIDEIFSYTGAYVDRNGTRYALVDMLSYQKDGGWWRHTVTELDGGPASSYVTNDQLKESAGRKDDRWYRQLLKQSPVITFAAGNLDRKGGEEIAMTVSAPGDHARPKDVAKCYLYTYDATSEALCGMAGLNGEVEGSYIPLYNASTSHSSGSQAMVSAGCDFGTFEITGANGRPQTVDALVIAGWDCGGRSSLSKDSRYRNLSYRYVYYDPAADAFVVSGYQVKKLGKDASHIVYTATEKMGQDRRYVPTLAPLAVSCARLHGLHQVTENDQVLLGGDVYGFSLANGGITDSLGSISLCSNQQNENSNTVGKEQVWIGDVVAGNVSGSDNYEESFLAVVGVHRDEDLRRNDDYYWMDVAHFTAKYEENQVFSYQTAQEGVICEGPRMGERWGTWISLCLPNVNHRGIQAKYEGMDKFYSAPQALAMLQDAPYFADLQESFHYIVLGGTGFERNTSTGDGYSWAIEGEAGVYGSLSGGFLGHVELEGELVGSFGYESQSMRTLEYGVSYESHAGEGNKVVVYTIPMIYYYYEVTNPKDPSTTDELIVPVYLEPTTAIVSQDVWDAAAKKIGAPKVDEVLGNESGDPSTYTADAMGKLKGSAQAFASKQTTTATSSQGATIHQRIATESKEEQSLNFGLVIGARVGVGGGLGKNEATAGLVFGLRGGLSTLMSSSRGFSFEGAVDNLPEQAEGYGFAWKLAVNKSHEMMPQFGDEPTEGQFWIVGYEVSDVTTPDVRAVSGLTLTGATDHSVTLSWNDARLPEGYRYAVAILSDSGTLSDWETVDAGSTSLEWGGEEGKRLEASTTYQFVITAVNPLTGKRSARSAPLRATTLPAGHTLTVSGADVTTPEGSGRQVTISVGDSLAARETGSYAIANAEGGQTYVEPRFTWYRKDLRSSTGQLVGFGPEATYGSADEATLRSQVNAYLGVSAESDEASHTSTLAVPSVSAADDGSVWYCNVSYNNALVSSHPIYLDVTGTVLKAGKDQVSLGRRGMRATLGTNGRQGFYRVDSESILEPADDESDEPGTDDRDGDAGTDDKPDSNGSNGGPVGGGTSTGGQGGSGQPVPGAGPDASSRTGNGGTAGTGDAAVPSAVLGVMAAIAAVLVLIGWRLRRR